MSEGASHKQAGFEHESGSGEGSPGPAVLVLATMGLAVGVVGVVAAVVGRIARAMIRHEEREANARDLSR
jgi:hypothetical protein